jgi:hypothetical protein
MNEDKVEDEIMLLDDVPTLLLIDSLHHHHFINSLSLIASRWMITVVNTLRFHGHIDCYHCKITLFYWLSFRSLVNKVDFIIIIHLIMVYYLIFIEFLFYFILSFFLLFGFSYFIRGFLFIYYLFYLCFIVILTAGQGKFYAYVKFIFYYKSLLSVIVLRLHLFLKSAQCHNTLYCRNLMMHQIWLEGINRCNTRCNAILLYL